MLKKLAVFFSASALVLGACGGENNKDEGGSKKDDKVNLSMAIWDTKQEPVLREILDNFEKENENIDVEIQLTPFSDYWTKLEAAATGGEMADVVWMNGPNFQLYAKNGIIEPLTEYLTESDIDFGDYPEGLVDLYTFEEESYGVPKDWDTSALWYNKEIFDNAGVDYPTDDWTFEDFVSAAKQLTDKDAGIFGASANAMTQEGMYEYILQNGGFIINEDSTESGYDTTEAIEALEKQIALIEDGLSPTLEIQNDTSSFELFEAGRVAMIQAASYRIPIFLDNEDIVDKIDLIEVPSMKQKGTVIHGLANTLNASSKHKEEAFRLIEYLSGEEANQIWAESGVVIPAYTDVLDTFIESNTDLHLEAYVNSLEYAKPYPASANTSVWNEMENEAIRDMFSLEESVENTLKKLANDMNEALSKEQ